MDQSIQLTSEEKMTLSNKMSMDLGHILLNEHTKEDSPEMTDVKEDVINLAKAILLAHPNTDDWATENELNEIANKLKQQ
jgi:hypothetical protein